MKRLQYQALRKCTGGILGANIDKISYIARVEDAATALNLAQARLLARSIGDPSGIGNIWNESEKGRHWKVSMREWMRSNAKHAKSGDGFTSVASRIMNLMDPEQHERFSCGGKLPEVIIDQWTHSLSASTPKHI